VVYITPDDSLARSEDSMTKKVALAWSGGKDCALALYKLQQDGKYDVVSLLTTITADYDRVSMHGVRSTLLEQQADSLGIQIEKVTIPKECSNEEYDARMRDAIGRLREKGIEAIAFGDIFLEDVRRYRESRLSGSGTDILFPLWKQDTKKLAREFIDLGFRAIITCVDTQMLSRSFAGKKFDIAFLSSLPSNVDPCGENGEFHTFVYDGPIFRRRIQFEVGEIVLRDDRFCFCDLVPQGSIS
jgi:uncharacterized protein (TIGR00290 family)